MAWVMASGETVSRVVERAFKSGRIDSFGGVAIVEEGFGGCLLASGGVGSNHHHTGWEQKITLALIPGRQITGNHKMLCY